MWIRLIRDWNSYRKGSVLELPDSEGLELIVEHKAIKAHEGDYMRNLSSPKMDKTTKERKKKKKKGLNSPPMNKMGGEPRLKK